MIRFAEFSVQLHGLEIATYEDLEALRERLNTAVREHVYPGGPPDIEMDVVVDIATTAGDSE